MEITLNTETKVEVKTLQVKAGVRYWEDSEINGVSDDDGSLTPCRSGDLWCPVIDLSTGIITNWEQGKEASIHFKVADQCSWYLFDGNGKEVYCVENEYVPSGLCPGINGHGDYIIMEIDKSGKIKDWIVDITDLQENEDY